jgi:hypothetical protein
MEADVPSETAGLPIAARRARRQSLGLGMGLRAATSRAELVKLAASRKRHGKPAAGLWLDRRSGRPRGARLPRAAQLQDGPPGPPPPPRPPPPGAGAPLRRGAVAAADGGQAATEAAGAAGVAGTPSWGGRT